MVKLLEKYLDKEAKIEMLPMQPGEIQTTFADITKAQKSLGYNPKTSLEEGLKVFTDWFQKSEHTESTSL